MPLGGLSKGSQGETISRFESSHCSGLSSGSPSNGSMVAIAVGRTSSSVQLGRLARVGTCARPLHALLDVVIMFMFVFAPVMRAMVRHTCQPVPKVLEARFRR